MAVSWKLPPVWTAKVVGVSFTPTYPDNLHELHRLYMDEMSAADHPWLDEPIPAVFVREPDNPHDANAIAVHVPLLDSHGKIGHLPASMAQRLAAELDDGVPWVVGVHEVLLNPHYPERPGITIEARRQKVPDAT